MHERRQHAGIGFLLAKRHLSIGERTLLLGAARDPMMVAFEPAKAVVGAEIVNHYAYFSSKSAWSASRARCTRIFNAPTVVPSKSAISSYERPSTCFITNASRSDAGSVASARSRSLRNSVRSSSSSGVAYADG